jgi:hypothetical protein
VVLGWRLTNSAVVPSTFSGWSVQTSCDEATEKLTLSMMPRAFQGSPTQKPSMLPMRALSTMSGGGTVIVLTSVIGLMPWLDSQ